EIVRTRNKVDSVRGHGVVSTPNGIALPPKRGIYTPPTLNPGFYGKVVNTGPEGSESDYGDRRYWIKRLINHNDETNADDDPVEYIGIDTSTDPNFKVVTATNLAECVSNAHIVPLNQTVWVTPIADNGNPPFIRWVFSYGTPEIFMQITASSA